MVQHHCGLCMKHGLLEASLLQSLATSKARVESRTIVFPSSMSESAVDE